MLRQTAKRYGLDWGNKYTLHDLLRNYQGLRSDRLGHSLAEACGYEGVPYDKTKAHRALADYYSALAVLRAYVNNEI